jgi:peptide/nickel transport system substrate-binding protein
MTVAQNRALAENPAVLSRAALSAHLASIGLAGLLVLGALAASGEPRTGGSLTLRLREDLPHGFGIHESPTISTMWPAMPCFSNLVLFDPMKPTHSVETIIPELAERWSWQDSYRKLVFFLRRDVTWHDGKPFTAADVKYTFDVLRETPDAPARLRINPRREWYANVEAVDATEPHTVVFRLKRPQPSLLLLLASGFTPIYAAHLPPASYRTGCIGTGPFKVKEWRKGEFVEYVKNTEYFVKGRPYLDGLRYLIISERGTATAALQTGRVDVAFPGETPKPIAEQLKRTAPQLVIATVGTSVVDHLIMNTRKPPFDTMKVRQAVARAVDRRAYIAGVYHGGAVLGASAAPPPYGVWGLTERDLRTLPGWGNAADEKAQARALLAEAGFGSGNPLRVEVLTRGLPAFTDAASFVVSELKRVGIDASLRQVETAQWSPMQTRGEFQLGVDRNGIEPDDPDANFFEYFACRSSRNFSGYCSDEISRLIERQSQELDAKKRRAIVHELQRKIEATATRPVLGWRLDYFTVWPHVKNLIPHQSIYGWGRMQEVWREK